VWVLKSPWETGVGGEIELKPKCAGLGTMYDIMLSQLNTPQLLRVS